MSGLEDVTVNMHVYEGERCMFCGINRYDQLLHGEEDGHDCTDRAPLVYTTETPRHGDAAVEELPTFRQLDAENVGTLSLFPPRHTAR